jgi:uncharacterized UPF0160 family protein
MASYALTHDFLFHADEIFAWIVIHKVFPELNLIRSRDKKLIADATIVFDMGEKYDGMKYFDHHQEECIKRINKKPYSSFGLIWKSFGMKYLDTLEIKNVMESWFLVDKEFVAPIDFWDDCPPKTEDKILSMSNIIGTYHPLWDIHPTNIDFDNAFFKTVNDMAEILKRKCLQADSLVLAKHTAPKWLNKAEDGVAIFDYFIPWQMCIGKNFSNIKLVIFPAGLNWRIQAVKGFLFPEKWAGKSEAFLLKETEGLVTFCHKERFLINCLDREKAIQTAKLVLKKK